MSLCWTERGEIRCCGAETGAHTHVHAHTQADMHYNLYLCGSAPAHVLGRICCNLSNVVFFFHTMYSRLRNGLGNDSFTAPLLRQSPSYVVGEIITNNLSRFGYHLPLVNSGRMMIYWERRVDLWLSEGWNTHIHSIPA